MSIRVTPQEVVDEYHLLIYEQVKEYGEDCGSIQSVRLARYMFWLQYEPELSATAFALEKNNVPHE